MTLPCQADWKLPTEVFLSGQCSLKLVLIGTSFLTVRLATRQKAWRSKSLSSITLYHRIQPLLYSLFFVLFTCVSAWILKSEETDHGALALSFTCFFSDRDQEFQKIIFGSKFSIMARWKFHLSPVSLLFLPIDHISKWLQPKREKRVGHLGFHGGTWPSDLKSCERYPRLLKDVDIKDYSWNMLLLQSCPKALARVWEWTKFSPPPRLLHNLTVAVGWWRLLMDWQKKGRHCL